MHRVGVSAPDIAGADESNLPAPESLRSTVVCFEIASGLFRPVPLFERIERIEQSHLGAP
jgi:hypothetical protein